ncbi:MAG TPA: NAD(P)H-binding protein [Streptosporangiaceae bacterium]|nr:NAD(P)H-binding protein [Streptosporangiaceae bacterium]
MTSPVLVTGGTGRLGRSVVDRLIDAGQDVRVLARRQRDIQPRVTFFTGDLRRGEGIDAAVRDAGVIIDCATSTKGDAEATTNLVTAAARAGSPHFVQPSIVGIDSMAQWGYVKTKLEVERIVENSGLPWTILRVTQFYSYCFENSRKLAKFPLVAPVPRGFRVQPVDSREVAAWLVELALGEPAGRAPDMSGPEISSWKDLFRSYLAATHQRKLVVPTPVPGSKAVRNGALLPPPGHTEGSRTWHQFLAEELPQFRGRLDSASRVDSA